MCSVMLGNISEVFTHTFTEGTSRGGGGGHSGTEGGRTFVTYFAEEGVFF